jgi:hypothetical protein
MRRLVFVLLFFSGGRLYAGENFLISTSSTELKTALTDLYSMNFEQANRDFAQIVQANPNDPFAYLSDAGALWWETSAQNGIIPAPDWLRQRFKSDLKLAIKGARRLLASSSRSDRAEGHFIIGLSLGELGEWDFIHHHWFKAFLNGRKALSHLKDCIRLDSTYYDAYLGLGSYDYQVSRFGFLLKAGAFLGGLHANERRGIEHLIIAEDRGPYSRDQAAIFLATLYLADKKDYKTSLSIIEKLRQKYPRSLYFEFLEIALRSKLGEWNRSLALGQDAFNAAKANPEAYKKNLLDLACGFSPQDCLNPQESYEIVNWLSRAIDSFQRPEQNADEGFLSLLHLYRGFGEDLEGLRDAAKNDYQWVLAHPDFLENHSQAQECLKLSCGRREILNLLQFKPARAQTGSAQ